MNQQIRDDIAFWAFLVLAHVNYFGGNRPGAAWVAAALLMFAKAWRVKRAKRARSFWEVEDEK